MAVVSLAVKYLNLAEYLSRWRGSSSDVIIIIIIIICLRSRSLDLVSEKFVTPTGRVGGGKEEGKRGGK